MMNKLINRLADNPKTVFIIDSLGALLTAFFLFVIIRSFNEYFGMPKTALYYLSIIAVCFCLYSAVCFFFLKKRVALFIRIIGFLNLLYCLITTLLIIKYYPQLTMIGGLYFLFEILIISVLVYIELNVATEIKKRL